MMGIMAQERDGMVFATDERSVFRTTHDGVSYPYFSQVLH
jgi:hypothetical protein